MSNPNRHGSTVNDPKVYNNQSSHTYNMGFGHVTTEKFGIINPICCEHIIERDTVPFGCTHELRNYTCQSPQLDNVTKHHDYFSVPMHVILPRTWNNIMTVPTHGKDLDPDQANCLIKPYQILAWLVSQFNGKGLADKFDFTYVLKFVLMANMFVGADSLFTKFRMPLFPAIKFKYNDRECSFEQYVPNWLIAVLKTSTLSVGQSIVLTSAAYTEDTGKSEVEFDILTSSSPYYNIVSLRSLIEFCNRYPDFVVSNLEVNLTDDSFTSFVASNPCTYNVNYDSSSFNPTYKLLNIDVILAFQMGIAQFYTDDKIDDIYSAERYKNYIGNLLYACYTNLDSSVGLGRYPKYYEYTGVQCQYDDFSYATFGELLFKMFAITASTSEPSRNMLSIFFSRDYFWALIYSVFTPYHFSMRFTDYFTGARLTQTSVGDTAIPVVNNSVDVIEMVESTLMKKFLNFCGRVGQQAERFAKAVLGGNLDDKLHTPQFLATQSFNIKGQEVENTANDQGNVTTLLRSMGSRYSFRYHNNSDRQILIGVSWYDMPRYYTECISRFALHTDRYDSFNRFLQNVGDRAISSIERGIVQGAAIDKGFGFVQSYGEYKQNYNYASGAFVCDESTLDSWIFTQKSEEIALCSDFIRSHPSDFDRFYASLTGAFGLYFHFIVSYHFANNMNRAIDNNPPLLGDL